MAFRDRYPTEIEFEIDRKQLLRYWRTQALIGCSVATLPFAVLIAIMLFNIHLESNHGPDRFGCPSVYFVHLCGNCRGTSRRLCYLRFDVPPACKKCVSESPANGRRTISSTSIRRILRD